MALTPYKDKTLAECKDLKVSVVLTNTNGYKYIYIQGPGITYDAGYDRYSLYLGKKCSDKFDVEQKVTKDCVIRLTVNADGEERWKLGRAEVELMSVDDL